MKYNQWNTYIPERKEALIMPIAWAVRRGAGRSAIFIAVN